MTNSNLSHHSHHNHHTGGSYLRHKSTSRQDRNSFLAAIKLGLTIAAILIVAILVEVV